MIVDISDSDPIDFFQTSFPSESDPGHGDLTGSSLCGPNTRSGPRDGNPCAVVAHSSQVEAAFFVAGAGVMMLACVVGVVMGMW